MIDTPFVGLPDKVTCTVSVPLGPDCQAGQIRNKMNRLDFANTEKLAWVCALYLANFPVRNIAKLFDCPERDVRTVVENKRPLPQ